MPSTIQQAHARGYATARIHLRQQLTEMMEDTDRLADRATKTHGVVAYQLKREIEGARDFIKDAIAQLQLE